MLNQSAEYALRVTAHLATLRPGETARAAEVAAALGLPPNYLSKVLHQLASAGVLRSQRGRSGGFRLGVPASKLKLRTVVAPFDHAGQQRTCVLGNTVCSDRTACIAHERWKPISEAMIAFLRDTTVEDLVRTAGSA